MMIQTKYFFAFFTIIFFAISVSAQTDDAETLLKREMQEHRIPGLQAAVVQRGKTVFLKSYGIADMQENAVRYLKKLDPDYK